MRSVLPKSRPKSRFTKPKYRRIVLKLSGEALKAKGSADNISPEIVGELSSQIKAVHEMGVEVAIVIGGEISGAA
jgi:uridylate kinase